MFTKKRVYLDYAAATPLSPKVLRIMKDSLETSYGNASAIHTEGQIAKNAIDKARAQVATTFQIRPEFVTFTSGGTEANNLAIFGVIENLHTNGRAYADMEIVTTYIEHPSVTNVMKTLERRGVKIVYVAVNGVGKVSVEALQQCLSNKTVLFSVAYANSEIGTVQSVRALSKTLKTAEKKFETKIYFHIDAAQAPLWLSCQFDSLQADVVSLDAGKCNGPKGVGVLLRSPRAHLESFLKGGGQEDGLRPGTESVATALGAGVAFFEAQRDFKVRSEKVSTVRDEAITYLLEAVPTAVLNGATGEDRLANNINISIPCLDTEFATVVLDKHGFAVSTKSACAGAGGGESTVVREISADPARATSTLRISLSPGTKLTDLKRLTKVLKEHIEKMKSV